MEEQEKSSEQRISERTIELVQQELGELRFTNAGLRANLEEALAQLRESTEMIHHLREENAKLNGEKGSPDVSA